MKSLISFELRKIIKKPIAYVALFLAIAASILIAAIGVSLQSHTYAHASFISGMPAIQTNKELASMFQGVLNPSRVEKIHGEFDSASEKDKYNFNEVLYAIEVQNHIIPDIKSKLASNGTSNLKDILVINEPSKVSSLISKESDAVKNKLISMYDKISLPFYYDYFAGWNNLSSNFSTIVAMILSILILVCISPIFAQEYSTKIDAIILSTKFGKNQLIKAKLAASYITCIGLFLIFGAALFATYGLIYGYSGYQCDVQLDPGYTSSPYAINFLQLYGWTLILTIIGLLFMTTIVLFVSSRSKNQFTALIISALFLFAPWIIDLSSISIAAEKILMLFPINIMFSTDLFKAGIFYNVLGVEVLQPIIMVIVAIVCIAVMIPFTYHSFKRHQVQA